MAESRPPPDVVELDARAYLAALRRRRAILITTTVLVVAVAVGWSFVHAPGYEARARVLVADSGRASLFRSASPAVDPNRVVQTELLAFDSPSLREDVRRRVGGNPHVSTLQVGLTDVVEVVATARDGRRAARVANAYAAAYVELRRADAVEAVVHASEQLQGKISELQRQVESTTGEAQKALIDQQSVFRAKLDQLEVDGALREDGAHVISTAAVPRAPAGPGRVRIAFIALVFGVLLGMGLALAAELLDDSLRGVADLQRAAPGIPVMGAIPVFERVRDGAVVSLVAPDSPAAEAVRTLRTSLAFVALERDVGVLQVTSPDAGEGKTSVVANVGVALARVGRAVVLVDCDLRRPQLHRMLGVSGDVGLTSVLKGWADLRDAVIEVPGFDNLSILPAGPSVLETSELLSSPQMHELIASLRRDGTVVLIDSPPVLPVADALATAPLADATLVVCRAGRSRGKHLHRCLDLLGQVRARVAGTVLNAVSGDDESYARSYVYAGRGAPVPSKRGDR